MYQLNNIVGWFMIKVPMALKLNIPKFKDLSLAHCQHFLDISLKSFFNFKLFC